MPSCENSAEQASPDIEDLMEKGDFYCYLDSTELAEKYYREVFGYAHVSKDTLLECKALEKLSWLVRYYDLEKASELAKQAIELYSSYHDYDTINLVYLLLNEANQEIYLSDKAIPLGLKALRLSYETNDSALISTAHQNLAHYYNKVHSFDNALTHSKLAYKIAKEKDFSVTLNLANQYIEKDSIAKALDLLSQWNGKLEDSEAYNHYYALLKANIKHKNVEQSLAYADSATECIERMFYNKMSSSSAYFKNVIAERTEKARLAGESSMKTKLIYALSCLFAVILAFGLYVYVSSKRHSARLFEAEKEKNHLILEHEKEMHEKEIKAYDKQLSVMRIHLKNKIDVIKRIQENSNDTSHRMLLSDTDWKDIEQFLEEVDNGFVSRLRTQFPELSNNEIELFMLLRLKISAKSLAQIYCISEKAIKQKLFLYKNKVGLEKDNLSLRSFIENF